MVWIIPQGTTLYHRLLNPIKIYVIKQKLQKKILQEWTTQWQRKSIHIPAWAGGVLLGLNLSGCLLLFGNSVEFMCKFKSIQAFQKDSNFIITCASCKLLVTLESYLCTKLHFHGNKTDILVYSRSCKFQIKRMVSTAILS